MSANAGGVPPVVVPEPPRNPVSRTGDLWILVDHRLLCGGSTSAADVRRLMKGERAILFATDPPFPVDYDGSNHPTRVKDWSASYGTTWHDSSLGAELYDGFIAAAVPRRSPRRRPGTAGTPRAARRCWRPAWSASSVGIGVLEKDCNAFDAAVAMGFVLQVVEPHLNGPGGEVPAIFHSVATGRTEVLCGQAVAPNGATIQFVEAAAPKVPTSSGRVVNRCTAVSPVVLRFRAGPARHATHRRAG